MMLGQNNTSMQEFYTGYPARSATTTSKVRDPKGKLPASLISGAASEESKTNND